MSFLQEFKSFAVKGNVMDLAGRGLADASSMVQAIRMAHQWVSGAH